MGGLYHFPFTGYPTRKRVPICQACERNLHSVVTIASRLRGRPVSLPQSTGVAIAPLPMDSKKFLRLIILLSPRKIEYHTPVYNNYLRLRYPCMPRKHAITGASTNQVTSPYQLTASVAIIRNQTTTQGYLCPAVIRFIPLIA